ncbi:MAG: hypothetical protein RLZZ631_80 [Cyanobacteriota bacterium]|jgi:predicted DNA-binding protein
MPLRLENLPPLIRGVRKVAGIPMPSRSIRVPLEMEARSQQLALAIGCVHADLLRLALRIGIERISEAVSEAQDAEEANLEARAEALNNLAAHRQAEIDAELQQASDRLEARRLDQISTEIDAAWEGLADA